MKGFKFIKRLYNKFFRMYYGDLHSVNYYDNFERVKYLCDSKSKFNPVRTLDKDKDKDKDKDCSNK